MTDKEIIKALERCPQHKECCYCNSWEECGNKRVLTASTLDLINRQQAEIEGYIKQLTMKEVARQLLEVECKRLQSMNQAKLDTIHDLTAEIEMLRNPTFEIKELDLPKEELIKQIQKAHIQIIPRSEDNIRAEAIKEFAEQLKKRADRGFWQEHSYVDVEDIDNLVKEMVGDEV